MHSIGFLVHQARRPSLHFDQDVVFFGLRPGEVVYFRFQFSNPFSCEVCNNPAQSKENYALKTIWIYAYSNRFLSFTAVHQRTQMSIFVRT